MVVTKGESYSQCSCSVAQFVARLSSRFKFNGAPVANGKTFKAAEKAYQTSDFGRRLVVGVRDIEPASWFMRSVLKVRCVKRAGSYVVVAESVEGGYVSGASHHRRVCGTHHLVEVEVEFL